MKNMKIKLPGVGLLLMAALCFLSQAAGSGASSPWWEKRAASAATEKAPCDEIYVVKEGESLQAISSKCGDLFILEENPYIQDEDDIYPGLILRITPFRSKQLTTKA